MVVLEFKKKHIKPINISYQVLKLFNFKAHFKGGHLKYNNNDNIF